MPFRQPLTCLAHLLLGWWYPRTDHRVVLRLNSRTLDLNRYGSFPSSHAVYGFLPAILFLTAIFTGGGFGGAIPAIMLNIPGTSSSVATAFDGYPMAPW